MAKKKLTDREIEELYDSGRFRLTQERNDFLLPQIIDFVRTQRWINLHPEYQRRLVWDRKKKSLLIESLLMNVPIPPVFLYEYDLNRYEVMDGQQRLNTVVDFYDNRFSLAGLETWSSLNGRTYAECPPRIQRGLDRRRISATILLAESGQITPEDSDVRKIVFERLNTGGQNLNAQELRNCLYSSEFNNMITRLASNRLFNEVWEIPPYEDNIRGGHISSELMENKLYKRMGDCEIVLRYFAFRRRSKIRGSVKKILDTCMNDFEKEDVEGIKKLEEIFITRLKLAVDIFGDKTFRIKRNERWALSQPLYDAVMVVLDKLYANKDVFVEKRNEIVTKLTEMLEDENTYELIVGRPNTSDAIKKRQEKLEVFFGEFI